MKNYPSKYEDLFSNRRKEKNLDLFLLRSNRKIAVSGISFGSIFVFLIFLISVVLYLQYLFLKNKNYNLQTYVESYNSIQSEIKKINEKNNLLQLENSKLSQEILQIRSTSALLTEISSISPEDISLYSLNLQGRKLEIKGTVNQNNGLENINLFILEINRSEFFEKDKTSLIQIKIKDNNEGKNSQRLNFSINATIIKNFVDINQTKLDLLESEGLSERVKLTIERGLTK